MSSRTFLNLSHNPFKAPHEGFFEGGDRKTHLDHLRHLSQWSRRVLVVTGPYGIGKTTLYQELSNSLEPQVKAARVSGSLVTSERELLSALVLGFGIGVEPNASVDVLADCIVKHEQEQNVHGRLCMAMIDDAHSLEFLALRRLVELADRCDLRVVLFTEASLVADLDRACHDQSMEWFEIRLTGLPSQDVRAYLEWRFQQARYRGLLPFTDAQVSQIVQRSEGVPHKINRLADGCLAELESGHAKRRSAAFPTNHLILVLLLGIAVGLTYLLLQPEPAADAETPPPVVPSDSVANRQVDSPADVQAGKPEPDTPQQPAEDSPVIQPIDSAATPPVDTDRLPQHSEDAPSDSNPTTVAAPTREPAAEPNVETAPAVPVNKPQPNDVQPPGIRDGRWLLAQNPQHYTLQLISLSSEPRARGLIEQQKDPSAFAIYRNVRNGRTLYVVTYGVFESSSLAQRGMGDLRGELAKQKPWIRPLHLVQQTVRNNS